MEVSAPSMSSGPPNKRLRQTQLQFVEVAKLEYVSNLANMLLLISAND
jgi:hypothetical protein